MPLSQGARLFPRSSAAESASPPRASADASRRPPPPAPPHYYPPRFLCFGSSLSAQKHKPSAANPCSSVQEAPSCCRTCPLRPPPNAARGPDPALSIREFRRRSTIPQPHDIRLGPRRRPGDTAKARSVGARRRRHRRLAPSRRPPPASSPDGDPSPRAPCDLPSPHILPRLSCSCAIHTSHLDSSQTLLAQPTASVLNLEARASADVRAPPPRKQKRRGRPPPFEKATPRDEGRGTRFGDRCARQGRRLDATPRSPIDPAIRRGESAATARARARGQKGGRLFWGGQSSRRPAAAAVGGALSPACPLFPPPWPARARADIPTGGSIGGRSLGSSRIPPPRRQQERALKSGQ